MARVESETANDLGITFHEQGLVSSQSNLWSDSSLPLLVPLPFNAHATAVEPDFRGSKRRAIVSMMMRSVGGMRSTDWLRKNSNFLHPMYEILHSLYEILHRRYEILHNLYEILHSVQDLVHAHCKNADVIHFPNYSTCMRSYTACMRSYTACMRSDTACMDSTYTACVRSNACMGSYTACMRSYSACMRSYTVYRIL